MSDYTLKRCPKCGEEKPATPEYFHRCKSNKSGFQSKCRQCRAEYSQQNREQKIAYQREYYLRNREKILAQSGEYQKKNRARSNKRKYQWYLRNKDRIVEYRHDWHQRNRERILVENHVRYQENREQFLERCREYRERNRDVILARKREYHHRNKQKIAQKRRMHYERTRAQHAERGRLYRQNNPHIIKAAHLRYRARKRSLPNTFTGQHWLLCLDYWHRCCAVCGNQLRDLFREVEPNADHWIPLSNPTCPGTTPDNMICLCNKCNHSKQDKLPADWLGMEYKSSQAMAILKKIADYFEWIKNV